MRIWVDLANSPHVPFFVPVVASLRDQGNHVVLTARVADHGQGAPARLPHGGHRLLQEIRRAGHPNHGRAMPSETQAHGAANASGRPGHHRHLPVEQSHAVPPASPGGSWEAGKRPRI